jgi:hypothetical protein
MLKVTYTETGLYLEQLTESIGEWIKVRMKLARSLDHPLWVEHCSAAILLPASLEDLDRLEDTIAQENDNVAIAICDVEYIEVSLPGIWIPSGYGTTPLHSFNESEGVFITSISQNTEKLLFTLWQASQAHIWSLWR